MANLKQSTVNWFFQPENDKLRKPGLDRKELEPAFQKFLKDMKLSEGRYEHFRYCYNEIVKGNMKPKTINTKIVEEKSVKDIKLNTWKPGQSKFDKAVFVPYKTGKGIDVLLSDSGGAMKGTSYVVIGEPGVGKTTILSDIQLTLQEAYPDEPIVCVQSEMKKIDLAYEYSQKPWMKNLNYIILKDDEDGYANIKNTLIKIFTSGYSIIFFDSIEDVVSKLKAYADMTQTEGENFLLELMEKANDGSEENQGVYTTVFAIQQVTKGGDFKGDNKLKHMTTGMIEIRKNERGERFIMTSKNRRCGGNVDKRLFFKLGAKNKVEYDLEMFNNAESSAKTMVDEKARMKQRTENFMEEFERKKVTLTDAAQNLSEEEEEGEE